MSNGPDTLMTFPRADCYRCDDGTEYGVDAALTMAVFPQHVAELQDAYGAAPAGSSTAVVPEFVAEPDADAAPVG